MSFLVLGFGEKKEIPIYLKKKKKPEVVIYSLKCSL